MGEAILALNGLTKKIGKKAIVDHLTLTINEGEVFGLLGPNGAGKTTTIRMIVGLISRSEGDCFVKGMNTDHRFAEAMSEIGAIVENPEMYQFLTGYQNLIHFARMSRKEITKERIHEVIELVELQDAIHQKVKKYSLGMRQRLGVAQAILHKPSLLILDEPTNGLDPQGIYDFREYLRKLTREGTSVLVSSHLLSEMQLMCDRVAIIQKGRLIDISSVQDLSEEQHVQSLVSIEVNDIEKAFKCLREAFEDLNIEKNGEAVEIMMDKEIIPEVNEILVRAGIRVYGIQTRKRTLEEKFLEMTKAGEAN